MRFIIFITVLLVSRYAAAFNCASPTTSIPVTVNIDKSVEGIILADLSTINFTCNGDTRAGFQDAIRIYPGSARINSVLENHGFEGYMINSVNQVFSFSQSGNQCIWPDANCSIGGIITKPLQLKIGIRPNGSGIQSGVVLPAGTQIAEFIGQQRGLYEMSKPPYWGSNMFNFKFVLANNLVLPTYTCNVNVGDNIVVKLPAVDSQLIRDRIGRYDGVSKQFDINLGCEPGTSVSVRFDGDILTGYNDVLKNSSPSSESVGIQLVKDGLPIIIGQDKIEINYAQANETLNYKAYYFYNGGLSYIGQVKSLATITFNYK